MNFFGLSLTRARHRYSDGVPDSSAEVTGWLGRVFGDDDPGAAALSRPSLTRNPMRGFVGWAYVAISRIARYGSGCPWQVERGGQPAQKSPLADLLNQPNPLQSGPDLFRQTMLAQELWGAAYWIIERNAGGKPAELWSVAPGGMKVSKWDMGLPAVWEQRKSDGTTREYAAADVIWFRTEAPGATVASRSPMSAAEAAIVADFFIMRHYSYFFEHGASPLIALSFPNKLEDADRAKLRAAWQQQYQGLKRWFNPMVLEDGARAESISSLPSIAWLQLRTQIRNEILAIFDCPPAIAGVFDNANFGVSIGEQRKMFWEGALMPRLLDIQGTVNRLLAPQVEAGAEFAWLFGQVPALRPDYTALVQGAAGIAQLLSAGAIDQAQAQDILREVGLLPAAEAA